MAGNATHHEAAYRRITVLDQKPTLEYGRPKARSHDWKFWLGWGGITVMILILVLMASWLLLDNGFFLLRQ